MSETYCPICGSEPSRTGDWTEVPDGLPKHFCDACEIMWPVSASFVVSLIDELAALRAQLAAAVAQNQRLVNQIETNMGVAE